MAMLNPEYVSVLLNMFVDRFLRRPGHSLVHPHVVPIVVVHLRGVSVAVLIVSV